MSVELRVAAQRVLDEALQLRWKEGADAMEEELDEAIGALRRVVEWCASDSG